MEYKIGKYTATKSQIFPNPCIWRPVIVIHWNLGKVFAVSPKVSSTADYLMIS